MFRDASFSPAFDAGDPAVLLVAETGLLRYRADADQVTALVLEGLAPSDRVRLAHYIVEPSSSVPAVLVTAQSSRPSGDMLFRCTQRPASAHESLVANADALTERWGCERLATLDRYAQLRGIATAAGSGGGTETVYGHGGTDVHVSVDGGRTFGSWATWLVVPGANTVFDLAVRPTSRGWDAVAAVANDRRSGGPALVRTEDGGASWSAMAIDVSGFETGASAVDLTPTGHLMATGLQKGIACSEDGAAPGRRRAPRRTPPERGVFRLPLLG